MSKLYRIIRKDKITLKTWAFFSIFFIFISIFLGYTLIFDKDIIINQGISNTITFSRNGFEPDFRLVNSTFCIENASFYNDAVGKSMYPTIQTGNIIFYTKYTSGFPLKEGMIVRFFKDGSSISHRIYSLYNDFAVTKGDNSNSVEEVKYSEITDVVIGVLYT